MSEGTLRGIEQGRAKFAYECVQQIIALQDRGFEGITLKNQHLIKAYFEKKYKNKENEHCFEGFMNNPVEKYKEYYTKDKQGTPEFKLAHDYATYCSSYQTRVKTIPAMVKTNGIGATFAFFLSKAKKEDGNPHDLVYRQTAEWLRHKQLLPLSGNDDKQEFIDKLISCKSPKYRAITIEVLALFNWLKRFADGLIEGEED